ncbi:MAG: hydrogenobyrinic acid a,c-diamide synthase (glutamine-hydrolyzing) [Gammaproteobacteria bacterium]|nr:hydrogenobyrinic acid a,c-diamide synthase (glutamine-hydrolyzing) [Gammaproteobacteria bacterium]MDH3481857.1 hydrogenobyrinic acid a,c-diamide synthase (glutamine-hydrolyzing) [Gammaproteobacteria bacterium]
MAHFFIAGAHKSSGKTSVAVGLASAMTMRGLAVQPFKKGPDYIDPLWLARAAGGACYNLDFFTMSHAEIVASFATRSAGADISLIEGNKGLFDGLDVEGADSNAALATMLSAPVVLVIDTTGMTRGVAPLLRGYLDFDRAVDIRGVILNKVGGTRHEGKLRAALNRYTDIEVLGAIGLDQVLEIPERHLGLVPANEAEGVDATIRRLADVVSAGTDVDRLIEIAHSARSVHKESLVGDASAAAKPDVRIAVARDAAFGFYYPDDLEAFEDAGAKLLFFDALSDSELPAADGLFIGGGFPEMCLPALAANKSLRADIRQKLAAGMPAYAECGGLMYLAKNIQWRGDKYDMVGVIPGDIVVHDRPQGRGYVILEETGQGLWSPASAGTPQSDATIPAHEFHYARLENLAGDPGYAYRVRRGHGVDGQHDGLIVGNLLAGFAHHRNTEKNPWVGRFVKFVRCKSA